MTTSKNQRVDRFLRHDQSYKPSTKNHIPLMRSLNKRVSGKKWINEPLKEQQAGPSMIIAGIYYELN